MVETDRALVLACRELFDQTMQEVPTSEYWRGAMKRARKERGWNQTELGRIVGTSQATISELESGVQRQSRYVPGISLALGIPQPHVLVADPMDERWLEAGRILRSQHGEKFRHYLELIELETDSSPLPDDPEDDGAT